MGHTIGPQKVSELLADLGYSPQRNRKTTEGAAHPDRNAQLAHLNTEVTAFQQQRDAAGVDFVIVRESTEDLHVGVEGDLADLARRRKAQGRPVAEGQCLSQGRPCLACAA